MTPNKSLSWKKQTVFSIIIVSLFFAATEIGIRTWTFFFRTPYERYNFTTGRPELVPNIARSFRNGNEFRINSKGFVGPEFDTRPSPGVYRIIAVGDSCTFTTGVWNVAYPALLESLLNSTAQSRRYEVINAGIEGYNSDFALDRIKNEIIGYRPNLVTIYVGWNDLMKVNPDHSAATGKHSFLATVLDQSYMVKALKKLIFIDLRPWLFQPKVEASETDAHAYDAFLPKRYEENLVSMISLLRQNGIEVILFTLPTVVEPGMSREDLKRQNVFFPYFAGAYSLDRFLSLHHAYNRAIRSVGQQYGVPVVDLEETFNQQDKHELFWDTMHPNEKGNRLIAKAVFGKLQEERRF
jgi:lysophospholipase L1-like esterase